jgi:hypothetical protein
VLPGPKVVKLGNVQIIVDISLDENGRAVGTVRGAGDTHARAFSGNLELLALIEDLYRPERDAPDGDETNEEKEYR